MTVFEIDCRGLDFKAVNREIKKAAERGEKHLRLLNVNGQRYICGGLKGEVKVEIHGFPGNDLGIFMDGPVVEVYGNAGDGVGNTMNSGHIIVHGDVGDVVGYSMRGGRIYVRGNAGYRLGIHLKEYGEKKPIIVVGGEVGDFLGEYMAGGVVVVLRLESDGAIESRFIAAGIHGGRIFVRGRIDENRLGFGAAVSDLSEEDYGLLEELVRDFCRVMKCSSRGVSSGEFVKIVPVSKRPFEKLYHQTSIKVP